MTLRVRVEDLETGDSDERLVAAGDYVLVCVEPCRLEHTQLFADGRTHVLTIKDAIHREVAS